MIFSKIQIFSRAFSLENTSCQNYLFCPGIYVNPEPEAQIKSWGLDRKSWASPLKSMGVWTMSFGSNPIDLRMFWRSQAYDFRSKPHRFEDVLWAQVYGSKSRVWRASNVVGFEPKVMGFCPQIDRVWTMSFDPNPIDLRMFWRSQAYDFRSKSNRFEDVLEVQASFLKHLVACAVRTLELFVKTVLWFKAKFWTRREPRLYKK